MKTNHAFLIDPKLVGSLSRYGACNGVYEQDLADFVAEVQTRVLAYLERNAPPKDRPGWEGLFIGIARNYLMDRDARRKTAKKYNAGPCEAPDEHAPFAPSGEQRDPVDAKRQLDVLLGMFERGEMPELGREILEGVADGVKIPAIGRELGLPGKEVRKRLTAMRRAYFKRLHLMGLMVMMIAVVAIFMGGPAGVGQGVPEEEDAGTAGIAEQERERAAGIREEALRDCDAGKWEQCEGGLDRARGIDPAGEQLPAVRGARERLDGVKIGRGK
jgi:DNA-directed RNA polymerase specialized sigma24 family protein